MKRLASGVRGEAFSDDSFLLPDDPAPYRGLYRFEATDDWLFFGRDDDTRLLIDKLVNSSIVTIVGPSGSGKSSLVRAGLIPKLGELPGCEARGRRCSALRATTRSGALQTVLSPSGRSRVTEVDELRDRFAHRPDGLITVSAYSADKPGPVLLGDRPVRGALYAGAGYRDALEATGRHVRGKPRGAPLPLTTPA